MASIEEIAEEARRQLGKASPGYQGNQLRLQPQAQIDPRLANPPQNILGQALRSQPSPVGDVRLANPPLQPTAGEMLRAKPAAGPVYVNSQGGASSNLYSAAAKPVAPATIAEAANIPPRAVPVNTTPGIYGRATAAASESARAALPPGSSAIGRMAQAAGRAAGPAAMGVAKRVLPAVAPVVEGVNVGRVAMDPNASKIDVATQAAEGVGRTASTIAGAGIGGAAGMTLGPVGGVVGAVAGGAAGYFAGDAGIRALRASLGLDTASPVDRAPPLNAAQAAPASGNPNVRAGPNGSTVQTNPDGSQQLASRPTSEPPRTIAAASTTKPASQSMGASARTATAPRTIAQAAPQYTLGENAVEIIRPGGERTVAIQTPGGFVEVPHEQFAAGQGSGYIEAIAKGQMSAANPLEAAKDLERTKDEGSIKVANINASSSAGTTATRAATDIKVAEMNAAAGKNRYIKVDGAASDSLQDGKKKEADRIYDTETKTWISAPVEGKPKPTKEVAQAQARKALASGAPKEQVNSMLQGYGYEPLK